jgi:endonuclease/exonuclease/phosphatase family metal-dependent hydrolase
MRLKLLTYNIHGLPWNRVNIKGIADWVFGVAAPQVICLQEVFSTRHRNYLMMRADLAGWVPLVPNDNMCLSIPGLECGSGLMTLVHHSVQIVSEPVFEPFKVTHGVDRFVKKGYFKVNLRRGSTIFQLFNVHLQSDVTEFWCRRLNYISARASQEIQLSMAAAREEFPVVIGDLNMSEFEHFVCVDPDFHITFPGTGEHLDHLLTLPRDIDRIEDAETEYWNNVPWSDHIPVTYSFQFRGLN